MPTYRLSTSDGRVLATGVPSWVAAARLADSLTRSLRELVTVSHDQKGSR